MITIYYRSGCSSSQRALRWLEKYRLPVRTVRLNRIQREELIEVLKRSEGGIDAILRHPNKVENLGVSEIGFSDFITFLLSNVDLIRSPIIVEGKKLHVGFNEDQIRQFLPKSYRRKRDME